MDFKVFILERANINRLVVGFVGILITIMLSVSFVPKKVSVLIDGEITQHYTYKSTVQGVISELDLTLREEDRVSMKLDDKIKHNSVIEIKTAVQFTVLHDGAESVVLFPDPDVESILNMANIEVSDLDIIDISRLEGHREIIITRVAKEILVEDTKIYFQEQRIANNRMFRGQSRIIQQGSEGIREKSYLVVYHDGEPIKKELLEEKILEEQQDRIIEYGTVETIFRGGKELIISSRMSALATAYCSGLEGTGCPVDSRGWAVCTGPYANGYTSIGLKAKAGDGTRENPHIIAVDPKKIPLRSLLYIEGLGFAYAADVGSAITGNKIDILMPTHQQAWWFGRQSMTVYVVEREI